MQVVGGVKALSSSVLDVKASIRDFMSLLLHVSHALTSYFIMPLSS